MKKIPLLPRYFNWIGLALITLSLALYSIDALRDRSEIGGIFIKTFVLINDTPFTEPGFWKIMEVDVLLTLILLTMLIGLSFTAFARRKTEDEMIDSIRLHSWSWAIISMIIIGSLVTIFIYGTSFITFSVFFVHLLLLMYNAIFTVNIWKLNKSQTHEE